MIFKLINKSRKISIFLFCNQFLTFRTSWCRRRWIPAVNMFYISIFCRKNWCYFLRNLQELVTKNQGRTPIFSTKNRNVKNIYGRYSPMTTSSPVQTSIRITVSIPLLTFRISSLYRDENDFQTHQQITKNLLKPFKNWLQKRKI